MNEGIRSTLSEGNPYPPRKKIYMDGTDKGNDASPLRVFLLEDDLAVATGLAALLEHEEHQVRIASSIAAANEELVRFAPDVLVADVDLPDGNGVEYCRRLRQRGTILPIVFISGHADPRAIVALEEPATGFLRKPFDFDALMALIDCVANEGRRLRPAE